MAKKNHIVDAIRSIAAAQIEMNETVRKHGKIIESQGRDIAALEKRLIEFRDNGIKAEILGGVPTKDVALKYGLSSARISQIAPKRAGCN